MTEQTLDELQLQIVELSIDEKYLQVSPAGYIYYKGVLTGISRDLIQDLSWYYTDRKTLKDETKKLILNAYNSSIKVIRDRKINKILDIKEEEND